MLDIARLEVAEGERVFIEGPSGSGKSTLFSLLGGVLIPREGTVRILGADVSEMPARRRDRFRADNVGFVFQMFNLVPYLSVIDNVTLPCRFSQRRHEQATSRSGAPEAEARRLLARLGLEQDDLLDREVTDLSIGQQQRVAAARALIGTPALIIADEPTSALDEGTRERFLELPVRAVRRGGGVAAVREPRYEAGCHVRSPRVHRGTEPCRRRPERAVRLTGCGAGP